MFFFIAENSANSESDKSLAMKLNTESENGSISRVNQNAQVKCFYHI